MGEEALFLKDILVGYTGTGLYMVLFFICFLYLPLKADKETKAVLFYPILLLLLLVVFNPLMVWIWGVIGMDQTVYWRTYWLLLMVEVIAYVAVSLLYKAKTKVKKYLMAGAMMLAIMFCGSFIVTPQNYTFADNAYKLSSETIAVADIINENNLEGVRVSVPIDILVEIRQYDAEMLLTFGREIIYTRKVSIGTNRYKEAANHLFDTLYRESVPYSAEELIDDIRSTDTAYIVQRKDSSLIPQLDENEYLYLLAQTEEHNIYLYTLYL